MGITINEFFASMTSTDNTEFVELFGTPGDSLDGLSLIIVEGDAGANPGIVDFRLDFSADDVIGNNGFFLIGNPTGLRENYNVTPDAFIKDNTFENSSLTAALVQTNTLIADVGDGNVVSETATIVDAVALTDGGASDTFFYSAPVVGPDGSFFPAGVRRLVDGVDTDSATDFAISDFGLGSENTPTPSNTNPQAKRIGSIELAGGAEINAFDATSAKLYVVSGSTDLQIVNLNDPYRPEEDSASPIDLSSFGDGINSVAVFDGIVAVAVEAASATANGKVVFLDSTGTVLSSVNVGVLPDMLTFTNDGSKVLVANEGEPEEIAGPALNDPLGSVSVIQIDDFDDIDELTDADVTTVDFTQFDGSEQFLANQGIRIFPGDDNTGFRPFSQDAEPEYIAVSPDGTKAFVTLQENNAVAVLNLETLEFDEIQALGLKDFSQAGNGLDPSDDDGSINIAELPVFGLYQPDAIASFEIDGETYYITANEGDDRGDADEDAFGDAARVKDLLSSTDTDPLTAGIQNDINSFGRDGLGLDPTFEAELQGGDVDLTLDENLGRLTISTVDGDTDGDGDIDQLVSYGGRSFTIRDSSGNIVFDSGDDIAQITASETPTLFNANDGDPGEFDNRSDNKGAEPEAVTVGQIGDRTYAFIGLERAGGGVLIYDVTDPAAPEFIEYARNDEDISPEGLTFIPAEDSPNGVNLFVVSHEESNTVAIYEFIPELGIYDIQGAGHTSAFEGNVVTTTGIVTAVDSNGFYLQDADGDGDDATSDGIFVFTRDAPTVSVGDELNVTGTVSEFFPGGESTGNLSSTQLVTPFIETVSTGNTLPEAAIIGVGKRQPPTESIDDDAFASFDPETDGIDFFESLEGMLVTARDLVAVSGTNRFDEIFAVVDNGVDATGLSDRGTLNISPDDFNPERIQIDADSGILPGFTFPDVNVGDQLGDVTGVVSYDFGNFQINPTEELTVTPGTLLPEVTSQTTTSDGLSIVSYNVLNLDPNDGDGDADVANGRLKAIAPTNHQQPRQS